MGLSKHKIVGIIPQRMGSSRLYGKAMLDLSGESLTCQFINRCKKSELINQFILTVPDKSENDVFESIAIATEIDFYRYNGDENDVMGRILETARASKADVIVRLIIDNPLIEHAEIDRIINEFLVDYNPEYLYSNTHNINDNGYPDGLGCEVYDMDTFEQLCLDVTNKELRTHPHKWFYDNDMVKTVLCPREFSYPEIKLDVNTQKEYEYIRDIFEKHGANCHVSEYIGEL